MLLLVVEIMIQKIKFHIKKYIFYDLMGLFTIILITMFIVRFINDYNMNRRNEKDYSIYNDFIIKAYEINADLFKFNGDNIAIVKMDDLIKPITNGKDTISLGVVPVDRNLNQCVGYVVVKKVDGDLLIDTSHICDMIDY